jgi:hypothetical protein
MGSGESRNPRDVLSGWEVAIVSGVSRGFGHDVLRLLCRHFDVPEAGSRLRVSTLNRTGFFGQRRHYRVVLNHGARRFEAFGKVVTPDDQVTCHSPYGAFTPTPQTEQNNLQFLARSCPAMPELPQLIGVAKAQDGYVYLFELVKAAKNLSTLLTSFLFRRTGRVARIITLGHRVLDGIHAWQRRCSELQYRTLDPERVALRSTIVAARSLLPAVRERLTAFVDNELPALSAVRTGVIHADLGPRNILVAASRITFVDWEAMQRHCLASYDPCYAATVLTTRCVQLFLSEGELQHIHGALLARVTGLEADAAPGASRESITIQVRLGFRLARAHLLKRYEWDLAQGGRWSGLRQRRRQMNWLIRLMSEDS